MGVTVSVSQTHGIDISGAPVVRLGGLASARPTMYMYILSRSIYRYGQQGITTCITAALLKYFPVLRKVLSCTSKVPLDTVEVPSETLEEVTLAYLQSNAALPSKYSSVLLLELVVYISSTVR